VQPGHDVTAESEAQLALVRALARVDRRRAFDLAMSMSGYHSHLALLALVDTVAAVSVADALAVIDGVPAQYTSTRAALLGTAARHVPADDLATLEELRTRLPQRGESEAFHIPFAEAGVALATRLADRDPALAEQALQRCEAGLSLRPDLRDPYTIGQ